MGIDVVVGGQFGSEGKGKTISYLCKHDKYDVVVRCGGPNSGHTVTIDNTQRVLRQLPVGIVNNKTRLLISSGSLIDVDIICKEIDEFGLRYDRLGISPNAVVVSDEHKLQETDILKRIGSTGSGTGAALSSRIMRNSDVKFVKDIPELREYLVNVPEEVMNHIFHGRNIVIEGTQGFGLSLYHSPYYPYVTSRDTSASSFISEVGISPLVVRDIIMVLRTFPIRVGGNSGPLPREISWDILQNESGYQHAIKEFTSVTHRLRRVARYDSSIVKQAILVNRPTKYVLNGIDYIDHRCNGTKEISGLSKKAIDFIYTIQEIHNIHIDYIGTGVNDTDIIERGHV